MQPRRLVLWDIDGTLIRSEGVGARIIEEAAASVGGLSEVPKVRMSGKTDPQIVHEIFLAAGLTESRRHELLPAALDEAERLLAAAASELGRSGRVPPGVREVLDHLYEQVTVRQSVVTGNLAANARVKLAAFDLTARLDLDIGAYGSDHPDRACLVPLALERAARLRGDSYKTDEVWVVGDTPRDLACARAAGVRCLLVATGTYPLAELSELEADATLADLSQVEQVFDILTRP